MVDPKPAFDWLTERWRSFYDSHEVAVPDRFTRREFGFLFYGGKFFLRHTGFRSVDAYRRFFSQRAPAHAYYSTAYYKEPAAKTMADKGWMGAELIFDLDADHVPGSESLPYKEQLEKVKEHFIRLLDEFVLKDFGFDEKDVLLTFSGGRGYHAHVLDSRVMDLTAPERREIVDYITATRLDIDRFLTQRTLAVRKFGTNTQRVRGMELTTADTPGWGGRLNRTLVDYLERLRSLDPEAIERHLVAVPTIGPKRAQQGVKEIVGLDMRRVRAGQLNQGPIVKKVIPWLLENQVVPLAKGETDEPVTSDTKRLIRIPGSLHGKTGLKVVTLNRNEIEAFDPLYDAVALGEEPQRVQVGRPVQFTLRGQDYDLHPGDKTRLPEAAAAFAMARGCALPVG